ncbi:MAG TPA: hypothetical protein VGE25_08330 [Sediminibacterium sp.]
MLSSFLNTAIRRAFICVFLLLLAEIHPSLAQQGSTIIPDAPVAKDTINQRDLIDIVVRWLHIRDTDLKVDGRKKIYFSFLPFGASVPGGSGTALITSTTAGTYLGPRKTTYLSTASFAPYWNFKGRYGLPLRTAVWLPNNTWTIQGDTRFLNYPQFTWGLGSTHNNTTPLLVDQVYIRFHQQFLKRIKPYLFAGVGYHLDYHTSIQTDAAPGTLGQYTGYAYGTGSRSFASGLSVNFLYDSRNNAINPLPGAYVNLVYRQQTRILGSDDDWRSLFVDIRKYVSMKPRDPIQQNTLAFWTYLWTSLDNGTPYLDLPSIGYDPYNRSGRGIDQNRYRGKTLYYAEAEYRRDLTRDGLFGFVVFGNITTVSGTGGLFRNWYPAAGTGLRVKFNNSSKTNIGIDYGFSKGYNSILISLGEAF